MSKYRSVILKGFSPSYTENTAIKNRVLYHLVVDINNYSQLTFDYSTKKFNYIKCVGGVITTLSSNVQTFLKNQVINTECSQTNVGMVLRLLKNNGMIEKYTNVDTTTFTGNAQLYPLTKNVTGSEADGFIDNITILDLERMGKSVGLSDSEADAILHGTLPNIIGFTNNELLDTTLSTTQIVSVLPNNRHELKTNTSTTIKEMYNSIVLKTTVVSTNTIFVTMDKTNKIRLDIAGNFSSLSLKRKD